MFGLILLSVAMAHRPHEVITAIAVEPSTSAEGRAWLVLDPHDVSTLMSSDDGGQHWDFMGGPPMDDEMVAGTYVGDELVYFAQDGTVWGLPDGAGVWSESTLPASLVRHVDFSGSSYLAATNDGVLYGELGAAARVTALLSGISILVAAIAADDPNVLLAATDANLVFRSADQGRSFEPLPPVPGGLTVWDLAEHGGVPYVGTSEGLFYWNGTDWGRCTELPATVLDEHVADVPLVRVTEDGVIYATTGLEGLFRSEDGCASWEHLPANLDVVYGSIGEASVPSQAFTALSIEGDRLLLAGFSGISSSHDGGMTWSRPKVLPEDYLRGLDLAPNFSEDPLVLEGGYGGGVGWTRDGGVSWAGSAVGMEAGYSYDVAAAYDFPTSGVLYYSGSNDPYRSVDAGQTWTMPVLPMSRVRRFCSFADVDYVLGEDLEPDVYGRIARSFDRGESWEAVVGFYEAADGAVPRDVSVVTFEGVETILIPSDGPGGLLWSQDGGETFQWLYQSEGQLSAGVAAWPPGASTRLILAIPDEGVLLSDDGGRSWTGPSVPPEGTAREFASADDGTLFFANRIGQFYRSTDGGDTWQAVGPALAPAVFRIKTAPNFARAPLVLVGTQGGVYWSPDAGETWKELPRYQRLDDGTHYLDCQGVDGAPCASTVDPAFNLGGAFELALGDTIRFSFKGDRLTVNMDGAGGLAVEVNGVAIGTLGLPGESTLSLTQGWHDVVLSTTDVGAPGFRVDTIETFASGEVLVVEDSGGSDSGPSDSGPSDSGPSDSAVSDSDPSDSVPAGDSTPKVEDEPCGCGDGGSAAGALLLVSLLARRRGVPRAG